MYIYRSVQADVVAQAPELWCVLADVSLKLLQYFKRREIKSRPCLQNILYHLLNINPENLDQDQQKSQM